MSDTTTVIPAESGAESSAAINLTPEPGSARFSLSSADIINEPVHREDTSQSATANADDAGTRGEASVNDTQAATETTDQEPLEEFVAKIQPDDLAKVHPRAREIIEQNRTLREQLAAIEAAKSKQEESPFADPRLDAEMKAMGYRDTDHFLEVLQQQRAAAAEAELRAQLEAKFAEDAALFGEESAQNLRAIREEAMRATQQREALAKELADAKQTIQQEALRVQQARVIDETLKQLPPAVHEDVRAQLQAVAAPYLPTASEFFVNFYRKVVNDVKATYKVAKEADETLAPTPQMSGGQAVTPTSGVRPFDPRSEQVTFGTIERYNTAARS